MTFEVLVRKSSTVTLRPTPKLSSGPKSAEDVGFNKAIFGHGPLAYKAPELFDGKPCSMASDARALRLGFRAFGFVI